MGELEKEKPISDEEFDKLICTPRFLEAVRNAIKASREGKFDVSKVTRKVTFSATGK